MSIIDSAQFPLSDSPYIEFEIIALNDTKVSDTWHSGTWHNVFILPS